MNQTESIKQIKPEPNQPDIVIIRGENESEDDIDNIKRKVKDLLIQFGIHDFVALTDPTDKDKILIMRKRQRHLIRFMDEIQLGVHQRLHLPF